MNTDLTLHQWQTRISEWAERTFKHNAVGIATHMLREVVEVCRSVGMSTEQITNAATRAIAKTEGVAKSPGEEIADVFILDVTLAGYLNLDTEKEVAAKHEINKRRSWGPPDEEGITEHIRGEFNIDAVPSFTTERPIHADGTPMILFPDLEKEATK